MLSSSWQANGINKNFKSGFPKFFEMTEKKLSQFGHNVWKHRPVKIVTVSFNAIMGQITGNVSV